MLGRIEPSKQHSWHQFVKEAHKQLKASYNITNCHLHAQHLHQKRIHDYHGLAEPFQVGERVWLYTPVVLKCNTKKLTSFWKGPYTVIDKPSNVTYKIQLIGATQTFVVHCSITDDGFICHNFLLTFNVLNLLQIFF